jgi:predicted amidophosphoribosyltransferase
MAARVRSYYEDNTFADFFGDDVVLMPVPASTPRKDTKALWVGERICKALLDEGLAPSMLPNIVRDHQVPKSAFQAPGNRPSVKTHYDSISVHDELLKPSRILLVDDIVTKGCTLLACASRVHNVFPEAEVRAFAMIRTMGLVPDIDKTKDPCVGLISAKEGDDAYRTP